MSAPEGLSADQQRYLALTRDCGLEHEEALHALGRRSGPAPEYRKLSRMEQQNKVAELVCSGLTRQEAERVAGASAPREVVAPPKTPPILSDSEAALLELASRPSKPGKPPAQCFSCRQPSSDLAFVPERVWLCAKCRKILRKARKENRRRGDVASYYNALTHPEYRGFKGIRK